jgi:hypothetical protein
MRWSIGFPRPPVSLADTFVVESPARGELEMGRRAFMPLRRVAARMGKENRQYLTVGAALRKTDAQRAAAKRSAHYFAFWSYCTVGINGGGNPYARSALGFSSLRWQIRRRREAYRSKDQIKTPSQNFLIGHQTFHVLRTRLFWRSCFNSGLKHERQKSLVAEGLFHAD